MRGSFGMALRKSSEKMFYIYIERERDKSFMVINVLENSIVNFAVILQK